MLKKTIRKKQRKKPALVLKFKKKRLFEGHAAPSRQENAERISWRIPFQELMKI